MIFKCYLSTHCMLTYLFCPLSKPVNPEQREGEATSDVSERKDYVCAAKVMQCGLSCKVFYIFLRLPYSFARTSFSCSLISATRRVVRG